MSRDRLRQAHAALREAMAKREKARRVAELAVDTVRQREAEAAQSVGAEIEIAAHHKRQMIGHVRDGAEMQPVPAELMEAKRRGDEADASLAGARAARDDLIRERDESVLAEKRAQDAVTDAAGAVMAAEAEAIARDLLAKKAEVVEAQESLRALDAVWLPRAYMPVPGSSTGPIRLPGIVGEALRAPAVADPFTRPVHLVAKYSTEWGGYLKALQADPEAVRIEGDNP